jgi:hypothetical protein
MKMLQTMKKITLSVKLTQTIIQKYQVSEPLNSVFNK